MLCARRISSRPPRRGIDGPKESVLAAPGKLTDSRRPARGANTNEKLGQRLAAGTALGTAPAEEVGDHAWASALPNMAAKATTTASFVRMSFHSLRKAAALGKTSAWAEKRQ